MSRNSSQESKSMISRRDFIAGAAASAAALAAEAHGAVLPPAVVPDTRALKMAGSKSGVLLGMFTGVHELTFDATASAIIAKTFGMIAVGNDLKFTNRLRPTPDSFDFTTGDADVAWAESHGLLFRGHCLVWWNALPRWFSSYVTADNARQVMTDHITKVVGHYKGRIYSWDVVNEAIYHDNRPDGLRKKPWLDMAGQDYIDLAFHTAHAADPKAKLVLNECYIEHNTDAEKMRRGQLLALAARLKKANVPITSVGVQGHLRGNTPLDGPGMTDFLKQVQDLGLDVMVTELDVDTINVPVGQIDQVVADKYKEFLEIMGPYVSSITFESTRDDPAFPKRGDGLLLNEYLLDANYQPKPAYGATIQALEQAAKGRHERAEHERKR